MLFSKLCKFVCDFAIFTNHLLEPADLDLKGGLTLKLTLQLLVLGDQPCELILDLIKSLVRHVDMYSFSVVGSRLRLAWSRLTHVDRIAVGDLQALAGEGMVSYGAALMGE